MKTENQVLEQLEKVIDRFNEAAAKMEEGKEPDTQTSIELSAATAGIILLGWVLDQEDEVNALLRRFKLGASIAKLAGEG